MPYRFIYGRKGKKFMITENFLPRIVFHLMPVQSSFVSGQLGCIQGSISKYRTE